MNKKAKRSKAKIVAGTQSQAALNLLTHPDAAGIDVGASEFVAAVPPGRGGTESVRTFTSFTRGVESLRDWLLACGIKTAALERDRRPAGRRHLHRE
jgi:transposase